MKELAIPHLRILDYEKSKTFYIDGLGFEIDYGWRHKPGFPLFTGISVGTCMYIYPNMKAVDNVDRDLIACEPKFSTRMSMMIYASKAPCKLILALEMQQGL